MNIHLDEIDNDIAAKHLLKHPFYLAWARGELSKRALADYARQYYHHVAAFPTYLSSVHANCDDQYTRKQLLNNLIDEEAGSPNHPELWLRFAQGLGLSQADVQCSEKWTETKNLIDTFRAVCRDRSTVEGLAALYAYESQIPAICESKIDGLKKTLRLQKSGTLRVLQRSCGSGSRTFCCRAQDAKRAYGRAKLSIRKGVSAPGSRRALGNALRRLPAPRHRLLRPYCIKF